MIPLAWYCLPTVIEDRGRRREVCGFCLRSSLLRAGPSDGSNGTREREKVPPDSEELLPSDDSHTPFHPLDGAACPHVPECQ